jgi:uncharacterized membrane protein required for colicin V production
MIFPPYWLNPFDSIIVFALLAGIALGFIRGLVRMVMSLAIVYVATVLAMTFYATIGKWLFYFASGALPRSTSEAVAFAIILVLTASVINFVLHRTYKDTELPGVRQIDQLGGMVVGFVLASTWVGLTLIALAFVLNATDTSAGSLRQNLVFYFHTAMLIPVFNRFLPLIVATLRPWMPKGLPPGIFEIKLF